MSCNLKGLNRKKWGSQVEGLGAQVEGRLC